MDLARWLLFSMWCCIHQSRGTRPRLCKINHFRLNISVSCRHNACSSVIVFISECRLSVCWLNQDEKPNTCLCTFCIWGYRWRVVWQNTAMELSFRQVSRNFNISIGTACNIFRLFEHYGSVSPTKPDRAATRVPKLYKKHVECGEGGLYSPVTNQYSVIS